MQKLILFMTGLLALSCSSDEVEKDFSESVVRPEITPSEETEAPGIVEETPIEEIPEIQMGSFSYSGTLPGSKASKIPTCKEGTPGKVHFELVDNQETRWISEKPVTESNGLYISEPDSLPIGNYRIEQIYLLSAQNDTLFAVPTQEDNEARDYVEGDVPESAQTQISEWADVILPIDITITDKNTPIEATAFCADLIELPIPGELGAGINTGELITVPIYITGEEDKGGYTDPETGIYYPDMDLCADYFYVVVDGYRTPERYTWSQFNQYHITIPKEYGYFAVYTVDLDSDNPNAIESRAFGPNAGGSPMYDPEIHGALIFDKCDPPSAQ